MAKLTNNKTSKAKIKLVSQILLRESVIMSLTKKNKSEVELDIWSDYSKKEMKQYVKKLTKLIDEQLSKYSTTGA